MKSTINNFLWKHLTVVCPTALIGGMVLGAATTYVVDKTHLKEKVHKKLKSLKK